jgi:hypothetical protein
MSVEVDYQLGALRLQQEAIRKDLRALRATRGQREVGGVKIPSHLAAPDVVAVTVTGNDPRACAACGRGLAPREIRICARCVANPNSDAGVELRAGLAPVLSE